MSNVKPIEVWVDENADKLRGDIVCHIENMAPECPAADREGLLRLIMISVREWSEQSLGNIRALKLKNHDLKTHIERYEVLKERDDAKIIGLKRDCAKLEKKLDGRGITNTLFFQKSEEGGELK